MLSINIPVYNFEITRLVTGLKKQAEKLGIDYEIRVYDDKSNPEIKKKNRKIKSQNNVVYLELRKNVGRAAIRNKMGFDSKYQYLLFIDADSKLVSKNFLSAYLRYATMGNVMCGGTVYSQQKPADPDKILRWTYGRNREAISAQHKNRNKGFIITSNNFLIDKEIFKKIHFREDIKKYGHEDTMLGFDLFVNGYKIVHFDNPVEHTGLENAAVFLNKTKMALGNLWIISELMVSNKDVFKSQVKFLNKYEKLTRFLPEMLIQFLYHHAFRAMEKTLMGKKPSMLVFDLYKLGYYATIKNRGIIT
jgi:cellulose synthase/poly-beta-1,6-N-acetylglucosamine synthase-like glycosyltransferase